jgi:hypothetical protein
MGKMLIRVPRMYTEAEIKNRLKSLPDDFEKTKNEFWAYVNEKLTGFVGKVKRVYRDGICVSGEEALDELAKLDAENFEIAKKLVDGGATFERTEDPMLIAESDNWLSTLSYQEPNIVVSELYEETMKERDDFVSKRIDQTLGEEEIGVLFMDPTRSISLDEKTKIIIMRRFDPLDYLNSWQTSST